MGTKTKKFYAFNWLTTLCIGVFSLHAPTALANGNCENSSIFTGSTFNLRIDNDLFGGQSQDQGYTNGFLITVVSPNLTNYVNDPCLSPTVRKLNKRLSWLQPHNLDELNMTIGLGQAIYTPQNKKRSSLIKHDRPYVGALMASVGYHARNGDHLRSSQLRVGVVGPAALGGAAQNEWHRIVGVDRFRGWRNQLHNEPVVQLIHERRFRWSENVNSRGWGWDAIGHVGGSLGNFATYANVGAELRFGYRIPNDFGTAPLSPAGENTTPIKSSTVRHGGLSGHAFVALDGRWVVRDITLDGNTFRNSHSVKKKPFVADIGYGIAITHGSWKFAFARYHRTKEFRGQKERPVYGTFTISKKF